MPSTCLHVCITERTKCTRTAGEQSPRALLKSVARKVGFANYQLVMTCAENNSHSSDAKEMICYHGQKKMSAIMTGGRKRLAVLMAVSHLFHGLFKAARKLKSLNAFGNAIE